MFSAGIIAVEHGHTFCSPPRRRAYSSRQQSFSVSWPGNGLVSDHGFRNLSNNRHPIAKAEDFSGLKLRALQAPLMIDTFKALGANAVPMAFTEIYAALESRAVDGQDSPIVAFATNRFDEVQKHLSTARHVYNPLVVLASKKAWGSLSADERKLITDAAAEARVEQRRVSREMEAKALAEVRKKGVVVTEVSIQERARMRDMVKPVADQYVKDIGEDAVSAFHAEIEKVRAARRAQGRPAWMGARTRPTAAPRLPSR